MELKLGVCDEDLEIDQIQTDDINCTGIPTHKCYFRVSWMSFYSSES